MSAGAVVLLPFGALDAARIVQSPHLIPVAFGMAMLASVVPYSLELAAMRRVPKRVFGILLSLEPAVATMAGWLLLGQHASAVALAAVVIVVAASTGSAMSAKSANPRNLKRSTRFISKGRQVSLLRKHRSEGQSPASRCAGFPAIAPHTGRSGS
jgi:inner membrane transporter RhtA